jgi:hypothetical protein
VVELGIHLGELWQLTPLNNWLRSHKRSRFLLTAPPLRLLGSFGSPMTLVATGLTLSLFVDGRGEQCATGERPEATRDLIDRQYPRTAARRLVEVKVVAHAFDQTGEGPTTSFSQQQGAPTFGSWRRNAA